MIMIEFFERVYEKRQGRKCSAEYEWKNHKGVLEGSLYFLPVVDSFHIMGLPARFRKFIRQVAKCEHRGNSGF